MIGRPHCEGSARQGRGANAAQLPIHLTGPWGRPWLERANNLPPVGGVGAVPDATALGDLPILTPPWIKPRPKQQQKGI